MNSAHLVDMANQIARFYESQPDHAAAVDGVAVHLKRFWDPRMRKALVAYTRGGGAGLRSLAAEAVARIAVESEMAQNL